MFVQQYTAAMRAMHLSFTPGAGEGDVHNAHGTVLAWMYSVHMARGSAITHWLSALGAFWPALQARGRLHRSARLHVGSGCSPCRVQGVQ